MISFGLRVYGRLIVKAALSMFEEPVVFLDVADVRGGLPQLGRRLAALGLHRLSFEDALQGVVTRLAHRQHTLGRILDVVFRIMAR